MATTTRPTGIRILLPVDEDDVSDAVFEGLVCTSCGLDLRGTRLVVAVPRTDLTAGSTVYSLAHDKADCIAAVT